MATGNGETPARLMDDVPEFPRDKSPFWREALEYSSQHRQKPHILSVTCADSRVNPARRMAFTVHDGPSPPATMTEQNVRLQMLHQRTHLSVAAAVACKELTLSGRVCDSGSGNVRIFAQDLRSQTMEQA